MNSTFNCTYVLAIPLLLVLVYSSCGTEPDEIHAINPNIIKIKDCCSDIHSGNYYMGQLSDNNLIATRPISTFSLDSSFQILAQENIWRDLIERSYGDGNFFHVSETENIFLFVKSTINDGTISRGALYEYTLSDNRVTLLKDSTYNISTAVYWHGDNSKLVYYSYGNDKGLQAGYYLYNKTTETDSLIIQFKSERGSLGPFDRLNGFDLSPDNQKLIIPNIRASSTGGPKTPQINEYNLQSEQTDTLDISFDLSFLRIGLWLRYSPDGRRVLYCQYPLNPFGTANDDSEVGIIELASQTKKVLNVNTNGENTMRSVQVAPTWSSNGKHIIYGSGELFARGKAGFYSLYILKNVDDPLNYRI